MHPDEFQVKAAIEAFKARIRIKKPPQKRTSDDDCVDCCDDKAPASSNTYARLGAAHQQKKSGKQSDAPFLKKGRSAWAESHLHDAIRANPHLLYTPELYAGGLYMEAIIDKLRLPFGLICDFCYVTVQARSIKITLVEIEQAAKKVFHNSITKRGKFHCETEKAVCQVRAWRDELQRPTARDELLSSLRGLFDHYPLEVFDEIWGPLKTIKIDIGYVLVVGNERPANHKDRKHHKLISDLYTNDDILFMTYPMMLDQVEHNTRHKNMLSVAANKSITIDTLHNPEALGTAVHLVEGKLFPTRAADDPFGIRLAGLGHPLGSEHESVYDPAFTKKLVYRSEGRCEMDGCKNLVVAGGKITGRISAIYDPRLDHRQFFGRFRLDNVGLICNQHPGGTHMDLKWAYESNDPHPMTEKFKVRCAYRPDLDKAANDWIDSWIREIPGLMAKALEVSQERQPELYRQVIECTLSLRSLPKSSRVMLWQIAADYFGYPDSKITRSADLADQIPVRLLIRAGLVRVNTCAKAGEELEPVIFSQEMYDHCKQLFGERLRFGLYPLFSGFEQSVASEVQRGRKIAASKHQ